MSTCLSPCADLSVSVCLIMNSHLLPLHSRVVNPHCHLYIPSLLVYTVQFSSHNETCFIVEKNDIGAESAQLTESIRQQVVRNLHTGSNSPPEARTRTQIQTHTDTHTLTSSNF